MTETTVIAYGAGNTASVGFALERLGVRLRLTDDPAAVAEAERVILPGVGAAGYAMARLETLGLVQALRAFPRPLLGVCLGQQLLFGTSEDSPGAALLGVIPGRVRRLTPGPDLTVPHMGWARLTPVRDDPLLEGVAAGDYAYFVHGLACPDGPATVATAEHAAPFPAVVRHANRWGCQFHPERSAAVGARILKNCLDLPC